MLRRTTILIITVAAALAVAAVAYGVERVDVCHAAGQAGTDKFVTVNVPANEGGFPQGHFTEDGTPLAGHEDDYLGACIVDETTTTEGTSPTTTLEPTTTTTVSPAPSTTTTTLPGVSESTTTTTTATPTTSTTFDQPTPVIRASVSCERIVLTGGSAVFQWGGNHVALDEGTYLLPDAEQNMLWTVWADEVNGEVLDTGFFADCPEPVTQVTRPEGGREFTPPTELPFTGTEDSVKLGLLATFLIIAGAGLTAVVRPKE